MAQMTLEKIKGTQFEIWLEKLLEISGCQNILRDVEFHKSHYVFRQADLIYNLIDEGKIKTVVVEAKYSSNGNIPFKLRGGTKKKSGQMISRINNLVEEVYERQLFTNADYSLLITNRHFNNRVKEEAKKKNIKLLEAGGLTNLYRKFGCTGSIDDSIRSIDLNKHNLNKNTIYIM